MTNDETNPAKKKVRWPGMPTPFTKAFGTLVFFVPFLIGLLLAVIMVFYRVLLQWIGQ